MEFFAHNNLCIILMIIKPMEPQSYHPPTAFLPLVKLKPMTTQASNCRRIKTHKNTRNCLRISSQEGSVRGIPELVRDYYSQLKEPVPKRSSLSVSINFKSISEGELQKRVAQTRQGKALKLEQNKQNKINSCERKKGKMIPKLDARVTRFDKTILCRMKSLNVNKNSSWVNMTSSCQLDANKSQILADIESLLESDEVRKFQPQGSLSNSYKQLDSYYFLNNFSSPSKNVTSPYLARNLKKNKCHLKTLQETQQAESNRKDPSLSPWCQLQRENTQSEHSFAA